jgi:hypothetical protein
MYKCINLARFYEGSQRHPNVVDAMFVVRKFAAALPSCALNHRPASTVDDTSGKTRSWYLGGQERSAMNTTEVPSLLGFVVAAFVGLCLVACASSGSRSDETTADSGDNPTKKTQEEVQAELMAFSDRFFAATLESSKMLENALDTPESRYTAAAERLVGLTVTTDIAASPNPGAALLDMTVYVTLKRMVWQDYWLPEVYGEVGRPALDILVELENDIWGIAGEVYTESQLDELRDLIDQFRTNHPDVVAVDFVRLTKLADARRVQTLVDAGRPGGMLAPVKEANRNLEEMRLLAERLVFMATRMQLMVSLQVEMASAKLATQPEVRQLLENSATFTESVDRAAEAFAMVADDLPNERRAAIEQLLAGLSAERERLLEDLGSEDGDLRLALHDVRLTLETGREMADALDQALRSGDVLLARTFEAKKTAARPFDIMDYQQMLAEATTTAREVQNTLAALERLLGSAGNEAELEPIIVGANRIQDEIVNEVIDRTFVRGVLLILVFFIVLTLYRWLARRLFPEHPHRPQGNP